MTKHYNPFSTIGNDSRQHILPSDLTKEEFEEFAHQFNKSYPCEASNTSLYPRPTFQLPDLRSPGGNTIFFFNQISYFLNEQGFSLESKEVIKSLYLTPSIADVEDFSELAIENNVSINEFMRFSNLSKYILSFDILALFYLKL